MAPKTAEEKAVHTDTDTDRAAHTDADTFTLPFTASTSPQPQILLQLARDISKRIASCPSKCSCE